MKLNVAFGLMAATVVAGSAQAAPSGADLAADLAKLGPQATLAKDFSCDGGPGYDVVSSGDAAAVKVAVALMKVADACYAEEIGSSFGSAMAKQPALILPLVGTGTGLDPEQICIPFLSGEDPVAKNRKILETTRKAVAGVTDPAPSDQQARCLAVIDSNLSTLAPSGG